MAWSEPRPGEAGEPEPGTRPPNVVLINCDDLGYGDLGCYGSTLNKTPALDRLAGDGLRLTSFYMASPVCSPSRAALLTGCYPPRIGFGDFDGFAVLFPGQPIGLPTTETTIATTLRAAGYRTLMVGKWHCGDQPEFLPIRHGFEHWFGIPYSNDMGRQVGSPPWAADWPPLPLVYDDEVVEQQPEQAGLTERYVAEAVRFMREQRNSPFFLYLAHLYVHLPIYVQPRFAAQSTNGDYGAAVESIDWATAVLLHELRMLGLEDDTIVIFTSDNGSRGGSNLPLRGGKFTTWEGGMRVPGIVRWPGRIEAGRTSDQIVSSIDLHPTLARLCGGQMPAGPAFDGVDVTDLLVGINEVSPRQSMLFYRMNDLEAIRLGRWKLHFAKNGTESLELYDLGADIAETTDVKDSNAGVVADLERAADVARAALGDARLGIAGAEVRPAGRVAEGRTLTTFDPDHPYYAAEYDLPDRG